MDIDSTLLTTGVVSSGLMAGLFYGWTVSVIPGLRRIPDSAYINTMQDINRAIINPAFIVPFMGIPVALAVGSVAQFRAGDARRGWLLAGAAATYTVGVLGITGRRNVPLNDSLDGFDLAEATNAATAIRRSSYETPWNRWHYLRTAASAAAFAMATAAAVVTANAD